MKTFREIAQDGNFRLVYRFFSDQKWGYSVAMGNCIRWNGTTEEQGMQELAFFAEHCRFYGRKAQKTVADCQ